MMPPNIFAIASVSIPLLPWSPVGPADRQRRSADRAILAVSCVQKRLSRSLTRRRRRRRSERAARSRPMPTARAAQTAVTVQPDARPDLLMPTHQRRAANKPEALSARNHGRFAVGLIAATEIHPMSNPKQNKPGGKPGQRARKSSIHREVRNRIKRRARRRLSSRKYQSRSSQPSPTGSGHRPAAVDRQRSPNRRRSAPAARRPAAHAAPAASSIRAAAPANTASIDIQTIALAYGEYTRKSFEQTKSFVEKLSGVRSLDKAIEIQTEFAKQAYETFVADVAEDPRTLQRPGQTDLRGRRRQGDPDRALNCLRVAQATTCLDAGRVKRGSGFPEPFFLARMSGALSPACRRAILLAAQLANWPITIGLIRLEPTAPLSPCTMSSCP